MICEHCHGRGYIERADQAIDACKSCAARAEAEWRLRHPKPARPALRIVTKKDEAA